ncbi:RHS repeat-associated core domain-containing protein [Escherichia marmotae]|uniref:RHS repeat-associated core domain-containing protein n=1 Tax=Escherichia marmotae TaxID=1499973 RepID=UPI000E214E21|nr:RHS repeat-associated core domain-containing protein [Escherichia marmotae]MED9089942.1 RHS repeat-associated core domain-containing protein [Escherichia marmotae]
MDRYLTQDPIKLAGGFNPYVYVNRHPVSHIDPLGLKGMLGSPSGLLYFLKVECRSGISLTRRDARTLTIFHYLIQMPRDGRILLEVGR